MKAPAPHSGKGALNNGVVRTSVRMSVATVDPSKVNLRSDDGAAEARYDHLLLGTEIIVSIHRTIHVSDICDMLV